MQRPAADIAAETPLAAVAAAERMLHRGEPVPAYNELQSALARWPGHLRLRQLLGLALARSGDTQRANRLLRELADDGHADTETLGMLARTHKDLALASTHAAGRAGHLQAAYDLYSQAFERACRAGPDAAADAAYVGINAAAMAVLKGNLDRGREIAGEVRGRCAPPRDESGSGASDYWLEATLGEAALILGQTQAAATHYARAAAAAASRAGDLSSTRRQARLLAAQLPGDSSACIAALAVPPVLIYTGHMIDAPGRVQPRFPAAAEAVVRQRLRTALQAMRPLAAYGSAACGADILCLEIVRELGAETHIVLPFPAVEFRRTSVDHAGGDWGARFERALAAADSVTIASDHRAQGSAATFEYANLVLTGMGALRAQMLDTGLHALAMLDPRAPPTLGGTAAQATQWAAIGLKVIQVPPPAVQRAPGPRALAAAARAATSAADHPDPAEPLRHEIRALLFADAVGYSQLSEDQIPGFISGFLECVARLNRQTRHLFEHVETSGDGLYMVFRQAGDAARYALELKEMTREFDRHAWGLPADFNLRMALHCGPVHCGRDPVTGGRLYTGPHTSRAARIEPITPPGQVYASSAFAAVAAAEGAAGIAMQYVGQTPLAKGYGSLGLYCVQPAAAGPQASDGIAAQRRT
jgi:hypothetical protein